MQSVREREKKKDEEGGVLRRKIYLLLTERIDFSPTMQRETWKATQESQQRLWEGNEPICVTAGKDRRQELGGKNKACQIVGEKKIQKGESHGKGKSEKTPCFSFSPRGQCGKKGKEEFRKTIWAGGGGFFTSRNSESKIAMKKKEAGGSEAIKLSPSTGKSTVD